MNKGDRAHMERLERRRDYLAQRIEHYRVDGNPSHDKAEVSALNWALRIIRAADREGMIDDLRRIPA